MENPIKTIQEKVNGMKGRLRDRLDSLPFFFFKQKTAYEMESRDWSSDVCSSDLRKTSPT